MENLRITLIQTELYWEDRTANLSSLEEKIWRIGQETDVIVLPEMFTTGFTMNAKKLAEPLNLHTFKWMKQMAAQTGALMLGSYIAGEDGKFYNRLLWMQPDGKFFTYDKRHLFRMADEHRTYSAGQKRLTAEWKGWRICPLICYDLRFPVWSRNVYRSDLNRMDYDVLIYVANWPAARVQAWDALLKARAVENLCYAAGVNRVGQDGNGIEYNGHSAIYGPRAETLAWETNREVSVTVELNAEDLLTYREKFPAWRDADNFQLNF
ncbi:MAG: amidohydrolase [Cyclobacteriaceae bacterium]|nr:amidohydrolase [Cyclobacteriaceae bacterium]MCX7637287.1 amidohydrolase [Cyclobacteriaceae bacterium]MDW8331256.1 amidohydrolase [Cyclobacteriaceae bacterium]